MRDKRIWDPDDSCEPFLFESGVAATELLMGRFTVPFGRAAVIASLATQTSVMTFKTQHRIVICKGRLSDYTIFGPTTISHRGALMNVQELDATTSEPAVPGNNSLGFILTTGGLVRPVRIVLFDGDYEVIHVGTNGLAFISLFGWTFPWPPK